MIVFFYEKVRLKRGVWQTVSIVLLIAFLCAFFTLFDGFICQKEQDMESAYAVIPVTVVVSNLTGTKTDDLKITDYIINYFLSDKYAYGGELQEKAFSSYVKDVCLKASVYYSQGTGFSSRQKLIGITSVDAASELAPVSGNSITYFEGYDESIFTSNKAVCLVSTAAAEELSQDTDNSGNVILTVQMSPAATGEASTQISLEIAGTYSSKSQTIYCPFSCVAAVQTELDGKITGDSLSATVRDNHELDEFRQILIRHFANVDPSGHQEEINNSPALRYQQFAITVHDETLRETLNALNRNLQTLYRLKPIFACIEVMIGAAAGFFYIHIRRREFAIARSLGTKRIETVIMVFVEICLMFLVGAAIGTILILVVQETAIQYAMAAALFFAMNVGAITACLMATGKAESDYYGRLSSMSVLSVQSVSYSYKTKYQTVQAVKDVSCDLSAGTFYALVGKSGSGKTTLLSLLAGLDTPQSGDIIVGGQSLREIDVDIYRRKQASVIYQSYNLFPLMTVCENVMYPLKLLRHSDADAKKRRRLLLKK